MIKCGGLPDVGYVICNCTCLLPMNNWAVFMKFHHQIMTVVTSDLLTSAIIFDVPIRYEVDQLGNLNYWHEIAEKNNAITPWFKFRTYLKSRKDLFNLHRNCFCHRESSEVNVNLVLYALYPDLLSRTQMSLWNWGMLRELKIEENFSEKRSTVV